MQAQATFVVAVLGDRAERERLLGVRCCGLPRWSVDHRRWVVLAVAAAVIGDWHHVAAVAGSV
jgi:hypothetical protein